MAHPYGAMDLETTALILQLQRDDLEAALSEGDALDNVALELQLQELNLIQSIHKDYTIAQSCSRAMLSDRKILAAEVSAEQQAVSANLTTTKTRSLSPMSHRVRSRSPKNSLSSDRRPESALPSLYPTMIPTSSLYSILEKQRLRAMTTNKATMTTMTQPRLLAWLVPKNFPGSTFSRLSCGHHYCVGCLSVLFEDSMVDETMYPPRCCRQTIPLDDAESLPDPKLVRNSEQKSIELDTKDRTYCFDPRCSTFIPAEHIANDVAGCPSCGKRTCAICKAAAHRGDCSGDEALQQFLQAADNQGWQRCYVCRRVVDLRSGCNHITFVLVLVSSKIVLTHLQLPMRCPFLLRLRSFLEPENLYLSSVGRGSPAREGRTDLRS